MNEILDKLILFVCCAVFYLYHTDHSLFIIPVILAVICGCLLFYYEDARVRLAGNILFAFLCIIMPEYIMFLPLLLYDIIYGKFHLFLLSVPFLLFINSADYNLMIVTFTLIFTIIAVLLKYKTNRLNHLTSDYNELRDSSVRMSQLLTEKNQSLLQNQDYEINLATLKERNRISKELHDSIGHLLSRSLLQVGALLTIAKDEQTTTLAHSDRLMLIKDGLKALKESLSGGMDQIRSSIHNMYDESIDLYQQMEHLVKEFTFCQTHFDYDIKTSPSLPVKHSLIAITKEALANIIRHSNATKVTIYLREHPAMYQLIIQDNGTTQKLAQKVLSELPETLDYSEGIGLRNICDRVKGFGGNINITAKQGFRIFITIPKKI